MPDLDSMPLYRQIAETLRQEILYGHLAPGDRLPPVRVQAKRWRCTPGTVQQAYQLLAREGLVTSRPGQGTRVALAVQALAGVDAPAGASLRQAALANQTERFLLELLAAGYSLDEAEAVWQHALARWRAASPAPAEDAGAWLRFAGSHDAAMSLIAGRFAKIEAGYGLQIEFTGSLGGLIALAQGQADVAGCHLWDRESDSYNAPFVRRLLPGRAVALLTLAHRRLGLIVAAGNPRGLARLEDLTWSDLRFLNRRRGTGTRVWLDAQLLRLGVEPAGISGYDHEALSHTEIAQAIIAGQADVGLGIEAAALAHGLAFVPLTRERYDLALVAETWQHPAIQALAAWLSDPAGRQAIASLGGYEVEESGRLHWVE